MLRPTSEIRLRRSTCAAGLLQRGGERVADRKVAQMADVQRLGRVGVPELDGVAPARGEVGVCGVDALAALQRPRRLARSRRRRDAAALRRRRWRPPPPRARRRSAAEPGSTARAGASPAPAGPASGRSRRAAGTAPAPTRRPAPPPVPPDPRCSRKCSLDSPFVIPIYECTSRGSNPDLRLTTPSL